MPDIPPIGLPNLVSQGDMLARVRAAQIGSEVAGRDAIAHELDVIAERRSEQVQGLNRVEGSNRRRRDGRDRRSPDDPHSRFDAEPDGLDDDEPHRLDVSA